MLLSFAIKKKDFKVSNSLQAYKGFEKI